MNTNEPAHVAELFSLFSLSSNDNGNSLRFVINTSGSSIIFQHSAKEISSRSIIAGLAMGMIISLRRASVLEPSILAASHISSGICVNYWLHWKIYDSASVDSHL